MEKEKSKILVRDVQGQQTLFECAVADSEKAYRYAAQMEELGLDVEVISPTLSETLTASLGLSPEARAEYRQSMARELEDHEGPCCFEETTADPGKTS
jgi:hypothetical protein